MHSGRILIAGPSWIGDLVITDVLLQYLHRRYPAAGIDILAPAWVLALVVRLDRASRAIELPAGHGELPLGRLWRLARQLRAERYASAYVLPRSLKSALVPFLAGVPRRIGYRGEYRWGLINTMRRLDSTHRALAERYVALALKPGEDLPRPLPRPGLRVDSRGQAAALSRLRLETRRPVLALAPGAAYGPAKRWPAESYAALAERAVQAGWGVWIFGGKADREAGEIIRTRVPAASNLTGRTRLVEAVDLIAATRVMVSNDSGLMHIAAAVATPVVALYGSSSPAYTPPLGRSVVLYLGLECSPCFARQCPLGHLACLRGITVESVWTEVLCLAGQAGEAAAAASP